MKKINHLLLMSFLSMPLAANADNVTGQDLIKRCSSYADQVVEKSGDELAQIGETPSDVRSYVNLTCIDAMRSAVVAKSVKELTQWKTAKVKSVWGFNDDKKAYQTNVINTSSEMAIDYYYNKFPDRKPLVTYPDLPQGSTEEENVSAMELYSSQKKLRGLTLKNHCERLTKKIPSTPEVNSMLKSDSMLACQGVMVANITQNQHGIPLDDAVKITEKNYSKNIKEYTFLMNVIKSANSLSK